MKYFYYLRVPTIILERVKDKISLLIYKTLCIYFKLYIFIFM